MLASQAKVAASAGNLDEARDLTKRAIEVSLQFGFTEQSAFFTAEAAAYEAAFGNGQQSRELALAALEITRSRDTMPYAAAILARAGAVEQAEALLEELSERFPEDTIINKVQAPIARAAIALQQQDPQGAVKVLTSTIPYQRGRPLGNLPQRPGLSHGGRADQGDGGVLEAAGSRQRSTVICRCTRSPTSGWPAPAPRWETPKRLGSPTKHFSRS